MPPSWLTIVSWLCLAVAFASAAAIVHDIFGRGHRQAMRVMEAVWPITALYFGPAALWAYGAFGHSRADDREPGSGRRRQARPPRWAATAIGVSHCGAGCTLGDVIAEFAVFGAGLSIVGVAFYAEMVADYVAAIVLGILFQYLAISAMRPLSRRRALALAAKADVLSLTSFELGLFAWMALMNFVFFPAPHHLHPTSPVYWFLMQMGMIAGFFTAWPANTWLIRRGIKEAMA